MSQTNLKSEYQLRFSKVAKYRNEVWKVLTSDFFQRHIPADSVVLDLGCGWGEFINNIRAAEKHGMDLNEDSSNKLNPDVIFHRQDCSQEWNIPDSKFDWIFTSNFLEHLPNKKALERTLGQVRRCLKPTGGIICLGPNIRYLPGEYWDFWDHHIPLSERTMTEILMVTEFEIVQCVPRFLPYSMTQGFTPPLIFLKTYLKMPLFWKYFGKQFLIMATPKGKIY
jgi:SAM-dependent methyltransferase